ncbi:MAG: antibiotic biosynthesis monooxygenase [Hyphomicrobiaceae bacterium]
MMHEQAFTPGDLNDGFVVAIQLEAMPGEEDRLADALQALVGPTMAEPGVKLFLPYRSPTEVNVFFVFELYENETGWAAHQETAHFKTFVDEMLPFIARRERVPFIPFVQIK